MKNTDDEELSQDDIKVLKAIVKREEAASLIWKWVTAFLYVAVPIGTLYGIYKSLGGHP